MKRFLSLVMVLALVFAMTAACAEASYTSAADLLTWSWDDIEAAAKEEGEVTFAIWSDEAEYNQICSLFTDRYGIKVNVLAGDKNTIMDKVLTELDGKGSIDVMYLSGETVNGLIGADALTKGILPIMREKDNLAPGLSARKEGVSNADGIWVPVTTSPAGFLYNADQFTPETLPQTFEDLTAFIDANPGKFAMCIPENGGTGQAVMESIIASLTGGLDQYLLAEGNVCDPALLEKWSAVWDWFNEHKQNITFTTSNSDGLSRLNSGEVWLVAAWNSNVRASELDGNLTINHGLYVPEMGLCYSGEVMSVIRNATHPAAALLFIDWMTTEEGQNALGEKNSMTARTDMVNEGLCLLSPEDRARNMDWMAACYKTEYIKEFTVNVLQ